MPLRYIVVCHCLIGDKAKVEVGYISQPKLTRGAANHLVYLLENEPNKCPGPHEIKEIEEHENELLPYYPSNGRTTK
jgi:hypothetical protein